MYAVIGKEYWNGLYNELNNTIIKKVWEKCMLGNGWEKQDTMICWCNYRNNYVYVVLIYKYKNIINMYMIYQIVFTKVLKS